MNSSQAAKLNKRNRHAFTLIELLVVIIIIAIVSSLTIPDYFKLRSRARFEREVQNVIGILAYARDTAVRTGTDTIVRFDPSTETFAIQIDQSDTGSDKPLALQNEDQNSNSSSVPRSIQLGSDVTIVNFQILQPTGQLQSMLQQNQSLPGEFRFHGDGTCDGLEFQIVSRDGFNSRLVVSAATGGVQVKSEYEQ